MILPQLPCKSKLEHVLVVLQAASTSSQGTAVGLLGAKQAALYSRATGTVKNIGFMCFMMWMSGSQIHLFSIMMTVSGIYQPLAAIMNSKQSEYVLLVVLKETQARIVVDQTCSPAKLASAVEHKMHSGCMSTWQICLDEVKLDDAN